MVHDSYNKVYYYKVIIIHESNTSVSIKLNMIIFKIMYYLYINILLY